MPSVEGMFGPVLRSSADGTRALTAFVSLRSNNIEHILYAYNNGAFTALGPLTRGLPSTSAT